MPPEQYREKWNWPFNYPMVAANAAQRSALPKQIGLGQIRPRAVVARVPAGRTEGGCSDRGCQPHFRHRASDELVEALIARGLPFAADDGPWAGRISGARTDSRRERRRNERSSLAVLSLATN